MYLFFILQVVFLLVIIQQNTHHQVTKHLQLKNTCSYDCIHNVMNTLLLKKYSRKIILWAASVATISVQCMYLCVCVLYYACLCVCLSICVRLSMCACMKSRYTTRVVHSITCVVCVHEVKVYIPQECTYIHSTVILVWRFDQHRLINN